MLLRVASVASTQKDRLLLIPEYLIPATSVTPTGPYGGVVGYYLTKYPTEYSRKLRLSNSAQVKTIPGMPGIGSILRQPVATLAGPDIKDVGSCRLFEAKNLAQMERVLPKIIMAMATQSKLNK